MCRSKHLPAWPGFHWVSFAIYSAAAAQPIVGARRERSAHPAAFDGVPPLYAAILRPDGQKVLDLGPTSSSNIHFITGLGHKAYNEDVLMAANAEPVGDCRARKKTARRWMWSAFWPRSLQYEAESFDAVLMWDVCDYLPEPLVKPVVERIYQITKPRGALLAFFHTRDAGAGSAILPLSHQERGDAGAAAGAALPTAARLPEPARGKPLPRLHSIKFFLGKENIREVLLVR